MREQLSSDLTLFFKFFFPALWLTGFSGGAIDENPVQQPGPTCVSEVRPAENAAPAFHLLTPEVSVMTNSRAAFCVCLSLVLVASCKGNAAGGEDANLADASTNADGSTQNDGGVPATLHCRLLHITPHAPAAAELVRIRVLMSDNQGSEVVLTELDEIIGGAVSRTLPMVPSPGTSHWSSLVFGFDGVAETAETALCDDLPPFEPVYFEMRGTVDGQPATGRCGFGPGSGGWPPVVRVSCGEHPVADSAIMDVYADPFAPPPGATELMVMIWLLGPATGVVLTPDTLIADDLGQVNTLAIGTGEVFEVYDVRADDPSTGSAFDGTVGAEGRAVFLSLHSNTTLGPEFCLDGDDPFDGGPKLHVEGTGSSDQNSFTWITSGFSCLTMAPDQDFALF
jgi:hypothetical protein